MPKLEFLTWNSLLYKYFQIKFSGTCWYKGRVQILYAVVRSSSIFCFIPLPFTFSFLKVLLYISVHGFFTFIILPCHIRYSIIFFLYHLIRAAGQHLRRQAKISWQSLVIADKYLTCLSKNAHMSPTNYFCNVCTLLSNVFTMIKAPALVSPTAAKTGPQRPTEEAAA